MQKVSVDPLERGFCNVFRNTAPYAGFAPYVPSINDANIMAFQVEMLNGQQRILVISHEVTCLDLPHLPKKIISHPDINGDHSICFYGEQADGIQCLFRVDGEAVRCLVDTSSYFTSIGPLGPTMNEAGAIAFRASQFDQQGIYLHLRNQLLPVATTAQHFSQFFGIPVINSRGEVVFRAEQKDGIHGIYCWNKGCLTSVVDTARDFIHLGYFPSMNDHRAVIFAATYRNGDCGIFIHQKQQLMPLALTKCGDTTYRGALINNRNMVLYFATPSSGTLGLYELTQPEQPLLAVGDSFADDFVSEFALNAVSMNHEGTVVLRIQLTNGGQRILQKAPSEWRL